MAERKNRSVVEAAREMLEEKSLPKFYWAEAEMPPDEREIGSLAESPISFRLSGPNERLSRFDQSEEAPRVVETQPCIPRAGS